MSPQGIKMWGNIEVKPENYVDVKNSLHTFVANFRKKNDD